MTCSSLTLVRSPLSSEVTIPRKGREHEDEATLLPPPPTLSFPYLYFLLPQLLVFCPGAMDTFARALLAAANILGDGVLPEAVRKRYGSFDTGIGAKIERGETNFEELEVSAA